MALLWFLIFTISFITSEQIVWNPQILPAATPAAGILESMTLEEKLGQMFICKLSNGVQGGAVVEVTQPVVDMLETYRPGGIIMFRENIVSEDQIKQLIDGCQAHSVVPLFVGVDEEGGNVSRIGHLQNQPFPSAGTIGKSMDTQLAYQHGQDIGQALRVLGFNMDFAPVCDIWTNPKNTVIGNRAFGTEPELVGAMARAMARGLEDQGICSVAKHFPGHGDTVTDSHYGMAAVDHSLERLREVEWVPFQEVIDEGISGIMVGHISVPKVTGDMEPAVFSSLLIGQLRNDMGFDGLIITDAMDMGAVTQFYPPGEAAVKAVEAGADIILMPADLEAAYQGLLTAVQTGRISESRIDESVTRILQVKTKYGFFS